ncbi:FAT2-like protein [Mya arenaria]|uniref:FAT2-like protein n=1 Tax=Mya arenaria TaxID=6604 RepID=A0ABY7FW99_MYAAR|nr:FAT2-like protein [Mya arenaria]
METFYVYLAKNQPPDITNLQAGEIQLNADISGYTTTGFDINVTVRDGKNTTNDDVGTPPLDAADPDAVDKLTYSLDCGTETGYFYMHPETANITFQSKYDTDAGRPTSVSCTITATDTGGLTCTASLTINIEDTNDNTPNFAPAQYSFHVSYYASAGTVVGTSSLSEQYFTIDQSGQIILAQSVAALGPATSLSLTATASDDGGKFDTAAVTITENHPVKEITGIPRGDAAVKTMGLTPTVRHPPPPINEQHWRTENAAPEAPLVADKRPGSAKTSTYDFWKHTDFAQRDLRNLK